MPIVGTYDCGFLQIKKVFTQVAAKLGWEVRVIFLPSTNGKEKKFVSLFAFKDSMENMPDQIALEIGPFLSRYRSRYKNLRYSNGVLLPGKKGKKISKRETEMANLFVDTFIDKMDKLYTYKKAKKKFTRTSKKVKKGYPKVPKGAVV